MTPGARLQAAIELGEAIAEEGPTRGAPADALVQSYFRNRRFIGAKDRAAIAGWVYGVLRARAQLDWWIERSGANLTPTPRRRALAYLALCGQWSADGIDEACDGDRFRPQALLPAERTMLQAMHGQTLGHADQPLAVRHNIPDWIAPRFEARFGDDTDRELAALAAPAALDVRVNTLRGTREAALGALRRERIEAQATKLSPHGIRISGRPPLSTLEVFKRGSIEVQDEGSQLAAALVDARPGMRVCDFCAGAGGKTLALAMAMENTGRITACDTSPKRLAGATQRLRRAKAFNVEQRALENERDPWVKRHKQTFDRVLVDAPCTGTGTWRRNPDAKWTLRPGDVDELVALQRRILDSAQRLVKPGGRLVYVTCSLLREEDEAQAEWFAASHPDFTPDPLDAAWTALTHTPFPGPGASLVLTPARHATDGFFVAAFTRKA